MITCNLSAHLVSGDPVPWIRQVVARDKGRSWDPESIRLFYTRRNIFIDYDFYRMDGFQLIEAHGGPAGVVCAPHNVAAKSNEAKLG